MTIRMTSLRRASAAVVLTGLLGFGLAACGSNDSDEATKSPSASASQTKDEAPEAEKSPEAEETTESESESEGTAEGDIAAFCEVFVAMDAFNSNMATLQSDPEAGMAALDEFSAQLAAANPPAEVADDYAVFADTFTGFIDKTRAVSENPTDPNAMAEFADAMTILSDQAFLEASENLSMYATSNCS